MVLVNMFAQRYSTPLRFATSIRIATAKGVLRPTLCNARATNAKPQVIPVGHLPQDKIGTSTSDIPSGNLSILILNRTSTAHDPNQHAENTHADRTQNTDHKPHTEHTQTQNTEHTHTRRTHTHTHREHTHKPQTQNMHTHNSDTQTHRHTDIHTHKHTYPRTPLGCSTSEEQVRPTKPARPNTSNQPAAAAAPPGQRPPTHAQRHALPTQRLAALPIASVTSASTFVARRRRESLPDGRAERLWTAVFGGSGVF